MPEPHPQLRDALTWLGLVLLTESVLHHDLDRILHVAHQSVPGCEGGSVTLLIEEQSRAQAVIDRIVVVVDLARYETCPGPYLVAADENRTIRVVLLPVDERLLGFAERAALTGVGSSLSLPVMVDRDVVGCLNLCSPPPAAFDATSRDVGAVLANQVGAAIAKSRLLEAGQRVAVSAQRVFDDRADIAVAQGMLMVIEQCNVEQAAALLRTPSSSEANMAGIARQVIAEVQSHVGKSEGQSD